MNIQIFSDPNCPWCLVGHHRLDAAMSRAGLGEGDVTIIHHPFLLDANTPDDGEDVVEMLKRKYGRAPDEMWDQLERAAAQSDLKLDMRKQTRRNSSLGAQILIQMAQGSATQHKLAIEIGRDCYLNAQNISDVEYLGNLAASHGLDRENVINSVADEQNQDAIKMAAQKAAQMGVSGVPLYIFNNERALSGCQPDVGFDEAISSFME